MNFEGLGCETFEKGCAKMRKIIRLGVSVLAGLLATGSAMAATTIVPGWAGMPEPPTDNLWVQNWGKLMNTASDGGTHYFDIPLTANSATPTLNVFWTLGDTCTGLCLSNNTAKVKFIISNADGNFVSATSYFSTSNQTSISVGSGNSIYLMARFTNDTALGLGTNGMYLSRVGLQ